MSNDYLVTSAWAPGLIGLAVSAFLYGTALGQSIFYARSFPNDFNVIKLMVLLIFFADTVHLIGSSQYFWYLLISCHRSNSWSCETELSWGAIATVLMSYIITFAVQCFYCHRIWIISGKGKQVTVAIFVTAIGQLGLGAWCSVETIRHGTINFLYSTPLVPCAAAVSTLCDVFITGAVFKYMWMSELRKRASFIQHLAIVFINMGVLTCLMSVTVGAVYLAQGHHYWVGAAAIVMSRCYVNSFLAVLNARRSIREREMRRLRYIVELPTLSTIV
ncbi:hypothetical protein BDN67DRAFT_548876 [Paxillus ammoniavirescens]|nr:hypothetical protein BDN67DRAFT_548876 [Paxillus ammoniavirescens]